MNNSNQDFLLTVNLALFKVEDTEKENIKKLPQKELMVLLTKREKDPYQDCWSLPYGRVDVKESLDEAVYRQLKEKTSLENIYFEQLYTWGAVNRDPSARTIATSYFAIAQKDSIREDDIAERDNLRWFRIRKQPISSIKLSDYQLKSEYYITLINEVDQINISYRVTEETIVSGFDKRKKYHYTLCEHSYERMAYDHIKILDYALDRIKNKSLYTNIAFGLISECFTLTELQQVFEVLLGKPLIKPNFRRWISKRVEETQITKKAGAYRPSKLYRLKKNSIIEDLDFM